VEAAHVVLAGAGEDEAIEVPEVVAILVIAVLGELHPAADVAGAAFTDSAAGGGTEPEATPRQARNERGWEVDHAAARASVRSKTSWRRSVAEIPSASPT
jgi:hypothetical protein